MTRKLTGLFMVLVMVAVQFGFAHAAVCRTVMAGDRAPVESHCGSMKARTNPGCAGMAGCQDLCKRQNPTLPGAGKSSGDTGLSWQVDAFALQGPSVKVPVLASGLAGWSLDSPPFGDIDAPDVFLLHRALLI